MTIFISFTTFTLQSLMKQENKIGKPSYYYSKANYDLK